MMTASLHCSRATRHYVMVEWVRSHGNQPKGGQDYFRVTVGGDGGEIVLYLSPDQLDKLTTKLQQAGEDRQVVLMEEMKKTAPLELAGGG